MDAESFALYDDAMAALTSEQRDAMAAVFRTVADEMVETFLVHDGDVVVGHTALRTYRPEALEVKKVFVPAQFRGRGISRVLMAEAERLARVRGIPTLVLQTGMLQTGAIALYEKLGYRVVAPFRGYDVIPFGVCYEKQLG